MAENSGDITGKCKCGAVIVDGHPTKSFGPVFKALSLDLPTVVCSCCSGETDLGGCPNHSTIETLLCS